VRVLCVCVVFVCVCVWGAKRGGGLWVVGWLQSAPQVYPVYVSARCRTCIPIVHDCMHACMCVYISNTDPVLRSSKLVIRWVLRHNTWLGLARTIYIHAVYTVCLAGKSQNIRSYTVHIIYTVLTNSTHDTCTWPLCACIILRSQEQHALHTQEQHACILFDI